MNNKLSIVLALVLSLLMGVAVYFLQENRISSLLNSNQELNSENAELKNKLESSKTEQKLDSDKTDQNVVADTFKYDEKTSDYYGKLVVNGYATISKQSKVFCEENCPIYSYVFFKVLNTDNKFLNDYLEKLRGNSFVGDMSIGIGCVENRILWRWNSSDEFGMKKYTNSTDISKTILNSSEKNPITLELERYLLTDGMGAPDCYSHFAHVNLAK